MESREQSSRVCSGAHAEKPLRAEPRAGEKVQRPPQVQIVLAVRRAGDCAAEKPGERCARLKNLSTRSRARGERCSGPPQMQDVLAVR